jgi:hypothetical protein
MPTTPQSDSETDRGRQMREMLNDLIGEQVVHTLGTPKNLLKVQVRPVGSDRYRVNVFVGEDSTSGRIANSYFLTADGEGKILSSSPAIVRAYGPGL